MLASQDEDLLDRVRKAGTVPIVRLAHNSVLVLEQPSGAARSLAAQAERHKWRGWGAGASGGVVVGRWCQDAPGSCPGTAAPRSPLPRRSGDTTYAPAPRTTIERTLIARSTSTIAAASVGGTP